MKSRRMLTNAKGLTRTKVLAEQEGILIEFVEYNDDKARGGHKSYPLQCDVSSDLGLWELASTLKVRVMSFGKLRASATPYDNDKVSVSSGNGKLGDVWNTSTSPGDSCMPSAPCLDDCYACALCRQYDDTLAAYKKNQRIANRSCADFWAQNGESVAKWTKSAYARPFVAGDMVVYDDAGEVDIVGTQSMIDGCFDMIRKNPNHWAQYTKAYTIDGLDWSGIPEGHNIFASTGWGLTCENLPEGMLRGVVLPYGDPNLPDRDDPTVHYCPCDDPDNDEQNNCSDCEMKCYHAKELGIETIVFILQTKWAAA